MGNRRDHLVTAVVDISRRLAANGWVANHDGNVTVRFDDTILATPTAVSKSELVPELVLTLDSQGQKLQGIGKPFSEIQLHLAAYALRPDIQAVVHAHPPLATARGLCGSELRVFLPEAVISLGDTIPVTGYAMPGTPECVSSLQEAWSCSDVVMVPGNGAWSVGRDLMEAYLRMELLEHLLRIEYYTRSMGNMMEIPVEDRCKLLEKRSALGLGPRTDSPMNGQASDPLNDSIRSLIAEELKKILKGNTD